MNTEFDRESAIEFLIDNDKEYILQGNGLELLDSILLFGFKGYESFSDSELEMEYNQRLQCLIQSNSI